MFGDQHVESLGGAQVSMRLQRRFLERAGHTVTIVAPKMHGPRAGADDAALALSERQRVEPYVDMPSIPITPDREYSLSWPGRRTDRFVDDALASRPPVDVVHVQADFWGAFIGHRFAARHGLPVVHTMHNRVDVGIEATAPFPRMVMRFLNRWQRRALREVAGPVEPRRDGWSYLRRFAGRSDAVTAPSSHFGRRLEQHGAVAGRGLPTVDVVWNGIDDDVLDAALAAGPAVRAPGKPRFVWLGRMSPEKRLLPFLEAIAASGVDADVEIIGGGGQEKAARRLVEKLGLTDSVSFSGRLPYAETLRRIAAADAVVQTSIGFETQGMTVFEAASLGTPAIVSDPDIGAELGSGYWQVADGSVGALASTLRTAAEQIVAGTGVSPDPSIRERFRQSSRSAAMADIYARVSA
ncbi:glycosyltransferase [Microbacterium sp. cf046]|uniref:glycosyltransferase n=1 Tax=Microbacterium sp. cf046 TaxID=1761803 RepID=UPI0034A2D9E2